MFGIAGFTQFTPVSVDAIKQIKQGGEFIGSSDTIVLLALYEQDVPDCLKSPNCLFALAIVDIRQKSLYLARDRMCEKPLYCRRTDPLIVSSEIRALFVSDFDINTGFNLIEDYPTYQNGPDPKSIYQHVHKLAPGHWMTVDDQVIKEQQYWDISQVSGGIDSGSTDGLMAATTESKTTTCSIGFGSTQFDEVDEARGLAGYFRTDHHEFTVQGIVEHRLASVAGWFDEPFSNSSYIPNYFVSQLARKKATVALFYETGNAKGFAGSIVSIFYHPTLRDSLARNA